MSHQHGPGPAYWHSAAGRIILRIKCQFPLSGEFSSRDSDGLPQGPFEVSVIEDTDFQHVREDQPHRQNDFQVIGRMQRVPVMPDMACLKRLVINPAEKSENVAKNVIQGLGPKYGAMPQFMDRIDQKADTIPYKKISPTVAYQDQW